MLADCLITLINSKVPCIKLSGREEHRYRYLLENNLPYVVTWDSIQGLCPKSSEDTGMPVDVLEYILSYNDKEAVFLLFDFHHYFDNPSVIRMLKKCIESIRDRGGRTIVLVTPSEDIPRELEKEVLSVRAPLPTQKEIYSHLSTAMQKLTQNGIVVPLFSNKKLLLRTIYALKGLTLTQIDMLLGRSIHEKKCLDPDFIVREKNKLLSANNLLTVLPPEQHPKLSDIGGAKSLKEWLSIRKRVFKTAASGKEEKVSLQAYNIPTPRGVLLTGVQGCGKSYVSKSIAKEWNLPLVWLDMGKIFSSRVGQSEAQMREALSIAEGLAPCVLFIDEFEKGLSGLHSSGLSDGGTAARVFGHFLVWMQERREKIFIVATTNDVQCLPPEMLRKGRFDEIFFVDLPDEGEREEIFSIYLEKHNLAYLTAHSDMFASCSEGFSGAEIQEAVLSVLYRAYADQKLPDRESVLEELGNTIPLLITRGEDIEQLREWADGRCLPAAGHDERQQADHTVIQFPEGTRRVVNDR